MTIREQCQQLKDRGISSVESIQDACQQYVITPETASAMLMPFFPGCEEHGSKANLELLSAWMIALEHVER